MTKRDENKVVAIAGLSNADGATHVNIKATPSTHAICIDDGSAGSDLGGSFAKRDDNGNPVMIVASSDDGETPVALYATAGGKLLVKST